MQNAADAPPPRSEVREATPRSESIAQFVSSLSSSDYLQAAKNNAGQAVSAVKEFFGDMQLSGHVTENPVEQFDPTAGGGCFGIPGLPEGVNSQTDKLRAMGKGLNKGPVDGVVGDGTGTAPLSGPHSDQRQKPIDFPNPLVEDGCFGGYGDDSDEIGGERVKTGVSDAIKKVLDGDGSLQSHDKKIDKRSLMDANSREQFDAALKDLEKQLGGDFQQSQKLAKQVFDAVADNNFDSNVMRDAVRKAAAELAANPDSPQAKKAMEAFKSALARGGVNAEFGPSGLKISDGNNLVEVDNNGNLHGFKNLGDSDSSAESTSVEAALKGLHHSYIQNALTMRNMRQVSSGGKLDGVNPSSESEKPIPKDVPIKVYEQALQDAMRLGTPVVVNVGR